jgi:hypothetical protein
LWEKKVSERYLNGPWALDVECDLFDLCRQGGTSGNYSSGYEPQLPVHVQHPWPYVNLNTLPLFSFTKTLLLPPPFSLLLSPYTHRDSKMLQNSFLTSWVNSILAAQCDQHDHPCFRRMTRISTCILTDPKSFQAPWWSSIASGNTLY